MHEIRKGFTVPTVFSENLTWNIVTQRCTKFIKHCACAVKWASLRCNSSRSGQTLGPARRFTYYKWWLWLMVIFHSYVNHYQRLGLQRQLKWVVYQGVNSNWWYVESSRDPFGMLWLIWSWRLFNHPYPPCDWHRRTDLPTALPVCLCCGSWSSTDSAVWPAHGWWNPNKPTNFEARNAEFINVYQQFCGF